jgi:hypothetical protein
MPYWNDMASGTTVCVLIGNSDNKLTQGEWSDFVQETKLTITQSVSGPFDGVPWFFTGGTAYDAPYQAACLVFQIRSCIDSKVEKLKNRLSQVAKNYRQESIAVLMGHSGFCTPDPNPIAAAAKQAYPVEYDTGEPVG